MISDERNEYVINQKLHLTLFGLIIYGYFTGILYCFSCLGTSEIVYEFGFSSALLCRVLLGSIHREHCAPGVRRSWIHSHANVNVCTILIQWSMLTAAGLLLYIL